MKREIIKIDEDKCNGCGLCIPNCHEGALQIIDDKARLISDLMCDGLGACIGHCPEGAMEIEMREAKPYDELQVMEQMVKKGRNTVVAHMKHLKDHGEFVFLKQAVGYLMDKAGSIDFPAREAIQEVHFYLPGEEIIEPSTFKGSGEHSEAAVVSGSGCSNSNGIVNVPDRNHKHHQNALSKAAFSAGGGCPGSRSMNFAAPKRNGSQTEEKNNPGNGVVSAGNPGNNRSVDGEGSQLTHWPVQMHLINPQAGHFRESDLLLAADCVAYSVGNFHNRFLNGKTLAIACPKLDTNKEIYLEKLAQLINDARINTLTVMKMEVPCCSAIEQMAQAAVKSARRKVPVKSITIGVQGSILSEEWL